MLPPGNRGFHVRDPPRLEARAHLGFGRGDLGLSHLVIVGGSREIDATVRERSDHPLAREVLPAVQAIA